jgi:menaquinone-dependent protoporphyrinogen IX oxidase
MEHNILVAYTTNAGSTAEVAEAMAAELRSAAVSADARHIDQITDLSGYQALVLGAPMILGWHRGAMKFLKRNRQALKSMPMAFFITAMSLTQTGTTDLDGVPVEIDPYLAKPPKHPPRLSLREGYATPARYLRPILRNIAPIKPVSMALLAGKLDYSKLKPLQMAFVMLVIQAQPGDRRNWTLIKSWASSLPGLFFNPDKQP